MFENLDFSELRLGEVGLLLDPGCPQAQEARASEFLISLQRRLPVKRIPCADEKLQGYAVMRRPLLYGGEAFVCARAYGYPSIGAAAKFMLDTLLKIDEENPPRFTVFKNYVNYDHSPSSVSDENQYSRGYPAPSTPRKSSSLIFEAEDNESFEIKGAECAECAGSSPFKWLNKPAPQKRREEESRREESMAESRLVEAAEDARREMVDRIAAIVLDYVTRFHTMPELGELETAVKGKIVLRQEGFSPVVVNGDLRVVLPDYNEMELPLRPLPRAVYLLFLRHPEGIVLKDIASFRDELEQIYAIVMPGRDEKIARASIRELTTPGNDLLRQKISVINRIVKSRILNSSLAFVYQITGQRGNPYGIHLDSSLVHLPAALRF